MAFTPVMLQTDRTEHERHLHENEEGQCSPDTRRGHVQHRSQSSLESSLELVGLCALETDTIQCGRAVKLEGRDLSVAVVFGSVVRKYECISKSHVQEAVWIDRISPVLGHLNAAACEFATASAAIRVC